MVKQDLLREQKESMHQYTPRKLVGVTDITMTQFS